MKRKIAAIFASDIAQYSRLVAEDEEETVRRLTSLRTVVEDFITRDSGRVFSLAGDAIYAEFPSAVDAVRCAIDIQESLRTRNLAYPPSRHMNLRIGITIGDVVDRDGALMGDGVNIAARLEGISDVGGICVSRAVHEQVANKLSVQFSDIGEQQVKNIPTPVHAFMVKMLPAEPPVGPAVPKKGARRSAWLSPTSVIAVSLCVVGVAALTYLAAVTFARKELTTAPEGTPTVTTSAPPPSRAENEALVPETVPFIRDSDRAVVREVYFSAPDAKALAISYNRMGFSTGQRDEDVAKAAALDACNRISGPRAPCELYAVGNVVVSRRGRIPMPPEPWVNRDPSIETPFVNTDIPFGFSPNRSLGAEYANARNAKAFALSPVGMHNYYSGAASVDEAVRRSLERCGSESGTACLIVAIDDVIVITIPKTMKPIGLIRTAPVNAIAAELRDDVARRLANATRGWNAVAAAASGRVGLALGAASEKEAIDTAMADCTRRERDCRIIAIGPFLVERLPATSEPTPAPAPTTPTPSSPQTSQPTSSAEQSALATALASATTGLTPTARDDVIRRYAELRPHKALAAVPGTFRVWRSFAMASENNARNKALEACQVYNDRPCALVAVDGEVQAPVDGKWPTHEMERVHYAGAFDPLRIPGVGAGVRRRPDIVGYNKAPAPKAAAYHPTGTMFIATAAASQQEAEMQALSACNDDPARRGRFGPCFLYAVGDEVVLPQRRTTPTTP